MKKRRTRTCKPVVALGAMTFGGQTSAADADVGSILGWGFPPYAGGTLSLVDMIGIEDFVAQCDRLAQRFGDRFTPPKLLRDMAAKGERFHDDSKLAA